MLKVTYRKHGVRLTHIYFATDKEIENNAIRKNAGDIIFLHGSNVEPKDGVLYTTQHTLLVDLSNSEEDLFASFGKHLRKHIRKCEREDNIEIKAFDSSEILKDNSILDTPEFLYNKMFSDKGMRVNFNRDLALKYCEEDALNVISAYYQGKAIGSCALIIKGENARAWVSAFNFRNQDIDTHIISRAHRFYEWNRLRYCKRKGVKVFDFGGINSFEEPNNIAKFKLEFINDENSKVTYNNYLIPTNLLGKIALKVFFKK